MSDYLAGHTDDDPKTESDAAYVEMQGNLDAAEGRTAEL